jgi:hypothetical protein
MKQKRIKDIKSYVRNVTELIWHYITNRDLYPKDSKLAVQPEIHETIIDNPSLCKNCDFYDLKKFIRRDAKGKLIPNMDEISNLAMHYYLAV